MSIDSPTRLWGGCFLSPPAESVLTLSSTAARAWRLVPYELHACRAHVTALHTAGVLTDTEYKQLYTALEAIDQEVQDGTFTALVTDEDVHTAVERRLVEKLGDLGSKVRIGRSRNDQASTILRLYLRDALRHLAARLAHLEWALIEQAEQHRAVIAPGMTHLQHAQPVIFAHHLLAHVHPLVRDLSRIQDWDRRAAVSPLGAAALAGSTIPLDTTLPARLLGFHQPASNSIDAVADRDFVAEALFIVALIGVHLSRLAEEVILWVTSEFGWAELDDSYATGSSIMPQKKNPDVAELTRGKVGRLIGHLAGFLATLKGLPLSYNRDLQEDKDTVFDALDTLESILPALTGMVQTLRFKPAAIEAAARVGFTIATDLAERLAMNGVPFHEAHTVVGRIVAYCAKSGLELEEISEEELERLTGPLAPLLHPIPSVRNAVEARSEIGATSPERVQQQLQELRTEINQQLRWATKIPSFDQRASG